jgi:integrase
MPDIVAAALMIRRAQQDGEREAAGEIWQQTNDMPSLVFTGRYGTPIDPRTLNRKFTARCEAAGVRPITVHARHTCATLLDDLDVHPRVIMRILRHADQAVTMEIYANASSASAIRSRAPNSAGRCPGRASPPRTPATSTSPRAGWQDQSSSTSTPMMMMMKWARTKKAAA